MNRRGFLLALAAAPVAAVMAPAALAKPSFASGGLISGSAARWGVVGEIGPELSNLPLVNATVWPDFGIPYQVAMKGFDAALADGDINDAGEIVGHPQEATHDAV